MGWPLGGNWDRATTPPGASTADFTALLSALCTAVNQREHYKTVNYTTGAYSGTETVWSLTGNTRPVAADFPATALRGSTLNTFMGEIYTKINALTSNGVGGQPYWVPTSSLFAPGVGERSYDLTKGPMWAWNWLRLKIALDRLVKLAVTPLRTTTSDTWYYSNEMTVPTATPASTWAAVTTNSSAHPLLSGTAYGSVYASNTNKLRAESVPDVVYTWGTAILGGKVVGGSIALIDGSTAGGVAPGEASQSGISVGGSAFTYKFNGASVSAPYTPSYATINAVTDITFEIHTASSPTFGGAYVDLTSSAIAASYCISGSWIFQLNMAAFLTDQT